MDPVEWVKNILSTIAEFASSPYQQRIWLEGRGPDSHSYDEAMCNFFDDFNVELMLTEGWKKAGLSETQRDKLRVFRDALVAFGNKVSDLPAPEEVLDHPEWPGIRRLAAETLAAFPEAKWATPVAP